MGNKTPNMSIYVPNSGEDLYGRSFAQGMSNIDTHDHSGAPDNGVQIDTNGIKDGAITPNKLSNQIIAENTVQTTNNTPTEISSIPVPESSAVTITGRIVCLRDIATESAGGTFSSVFHRSTGGNVTLVNVVLVDFQDDSSGTPSFNIVADIPNQAASLQVTGEAAKTFNWKVAYNVITLP